MEHPALPPPAQAHAHAHAHAHELWAQPPPPRLEWLDELDDLDELEPDDLGTTIGVTCTRIYVFGEWL